MLSLLQLLDGHGMDLIESMGYSRTGLLFQSILSAGVGVTCGVFILKGRPWSRKLYVGLIAFGSIAGLVFVPAMRLMSLIGLVSLGVLAFFLFRPIANDYFDGNIESMKEWMEQRRQLARVRAVGKNPSDFLQIVGVFLASGAGILLTLLAFSFMAPSIYFRVGATIVLGIPASVMLGTGCVAWGKARWAGLMGWSLSAAGAASVLNGVLLLFLYHLEPWQQALRSADAGAEMFTLPNMLAVLVVGSITGIIGGSLLQIQHTRDMRALSESLTPS